MPPMGIILRHMQVTTDAGVYFTTLQDAIAVEIIPGVGLLLASRRKELFLRHMQDATAAGV